MRASRLLSILMLLQLRGRQTAETLAEEFEVSVRTIYRDVDALSAAGVPIYGDKGHGGGFALLDGYRTQLTGLDAAEAEAMLLIGLPEQAMTMGLGDAAFRARNKLMAALPGDRGDDAHRIAARFHLDTRDWYRALRPVPHLSTLARAVLDGTRLAIRYRSWTATRDWTLDPLGLVSKAGNWYLVAAAAGKTMMFNVADVESAQPLDEHFERSGFDLARWWAGATRDFETRLRPHLATLRASPLGRERLAEYGAHAADAVAAAAPDGDDGWAAIELPIESIVQAAAMLLAIGPEIEVIAPRSLRDEVVRLARAVVSRHSYA